MKTFGAFGSFGSSGAFGSFGRFRGFAALVALLLTLGAGVSAQQPANEWNFDEEDEQAATWAEDIRAQAVDIAAVAAFLTLAFVSFFRKSKRLKYLTLVVAVAYLGVAKSQLISIVNVF